jgi:hypothetical protein
MSATLTIGDFAGQVGVLPRLCRLVSTDNLATVTTLNYLQNALKLDGPLFPSDFVFVSCSNAQAICKVVISGSNVTLTSLVSG